MVSLTILTITVDEQLKKLNGTGGAIIGSPFKATPVDLHVKHPITSPFVPKAQ